VGEKIKLEEETISKILVADTNLESGAEVSDVEDDFEEEEEEEEKEEQEQEEEEEEEQQQQRWRRRRRRQQQQVADYQPGDHVKD